MTAAWLVVPPVAVMMPWAAIIPCRSAGLVVGRASITRRPSAARYLARSGSSTRMPLAWPGQAPVPVANRRPAPRAASTSAGANPGCCTWRTCSAVSIPAALSGAMVPSRTKSAAIRTAAPAVRLALRTCRKNSRERSTVNSMSSTSPCRCSRSAQAERSSAYTEGMVPASTLIGSGVRMPATTSSPWLLDRNSPNSSRSPVTGLRVNTTPEPESPLRLPNTMDWMTTAVPRSCGMW